jgi:hypothetical protein
MQEMIKEVMSRKLQNLVHIKNKNYMKKQIDFPPISIAEKLKKQFEAFQNEPTPKGIQLKLLKETIALQDFIKNWDVKEHDVFDEFI